VANSLSPSVLALRISGDMGGLTYYTSKRGRTVAFPAAPPTKPASVLQLKCRQRFAWAVQAWTLLSASEKASYEACSLALKMCMTGHDIWVSLCMKRDLDLWHTLQHQSGIPLVKPVRLRSLAQMP
jgi:hypothetical protein